ncbi:MAG: ATP-binding protein [Myxococcota bacterium]
MPRVEGTWGVERSKQIRRENGGSGETVLVLATPNRDAEVAEATLKHLGISARIVPSLDRLREELSDGSGGVAALLMAEEALAGTGEGVLAQALREQPPWSDLPVILLAAPTSTLAVSRLGDLLEKLGNVTILERPMRRLTLLVAVQVALRQRRRQYAMRDLLAEQERGVELRDHFLAMLGHELRNPLSAIVLANQLLDEDDPKRFARYREVVERQAANLHRLVEDILDVSRINRGQLRVEKRPLDLRSVAQAAIESDRRALEQQGLVVLERLAQEPVPVAADPTRMEQVLHNLLDNAAKFTPPGGQVEVGVEAEDGRALLWVRDTGEGIPREKLDEVFGLFTQPSEVAGRHRGGLGLGLPLVDQLVRLHDGKIVARSAGLGKGSTFEVSLPLIEEERLAVGDGRRRPPAEAIETKRRAAPAPAEPGRTETMEKEGTEARTSPLVLLVEDDEDNRHMLGLLLRRAGLKVRAAATGEEALEALKEVRPDVCLVDIGLPGIDGYQVGEQARRILGKEALLVALTGYGHSEAKRRTREAGFDVHMTKPVDVPKLRALIAARNGRGQPSSEERPRV